jgi:hypothetical protein
MMAQDEPIPPNYESWSLFLICNPRWMVGESESEVWNLHEAFMAFGNAIGPRHAAVWFWTEHYVADAISSVDFVRNAAWCDALDLTLSESPHMVIMTEYPGAGIASEFPDTFNVPAEMVQISLNNVDASETAELITEWAERVRDGSVFDAEPESTGFLQGWQRLFSDLKEAVLGTSDRVTVGLNAGVLSVEVGPGSPN